MHGDQSTLLMMTRSMRCAWARLRACCGLAVLPSNNDIALRVHMLALIIATHLALGQSPSDPTRGVPGMMCHKGLLFKNATQSSEILADYNFNFMSEMALNSSIWAAQNGADCKKSEYGCSAIGYQWCTHGKFCGCLAGNDMGYLISSIGDSSPATDPAECSDPCWCTALLPQYLKSVGLGNASDACQEDKFSCNTALGTCAAANSSHPGNYTSRSSCAADCHAPPPPPPLAQNPCIRFGHTIPTPHHVDATIVQESDPSINHTWTNFKVSRAVTLKFAAVTCTCHPPPTTHLSLLPCGCCASTVRRFLRL
jgi:hypothetical protein